jgi:heptosyltransferase I
MEHTTNIHANLVGETTLIRLLAILNKAILVIAPDTGPAHMATTQGTPVVGLYAHSNPRRTGPYHCIATTASVYDEWVQKQYGTTWQTLPWGKRVKGGDIMQGITVNAVKKLIHKALNNETEQAL